MTLEAIATRIKTAKDLCDLHEALVEFETAANADDEDGCPAFEPADTENLLHYYGIDLCALPTFGGDEPRNTDGLWSYDKGNLLVGEGPFKDWRIFDREDEGQAWRA